MTNYMVNWRTGSGFQANYLLIRQFEKLLSYSNHLGLFSEDIDFKTKRLLGNFPQAYSHLALIETAINLSNITKQEQVKEVLS